MLPLEQHLRRLAVAFGRSDVARFGSEMSFDAFCEWLAFEAEYGPLDVGSRLDVMHAPIRPVVAGIGGTRLRQRDAVIHWTQPRQSDEEIEAAITAWAKRYGNHSQSGPATDGGQ